MQPANFTRYLLCFSFFSLILFSPVLAQHEGHQPKPPTTKPQVRQLKKPPAPPRQPATQKPVTTRPPAPKQATPPKPVSTRPPVPKSTTTPPKPAAAPIADTTHQHLEMPEAVIGPDTIHRHHQSGATEHGGHQEHDGMNMTHSFSRNLPMTRNGSGTGWMPDATPMYASMNHLGNWGLMFHVSTWLRYNRQNLNNKEKWDNGRGGSQLDMPNWFMGMAQRPVGERGLFTARLMMSLDPLTVGGNGYPLLFQTGETYEGKPLIDRQHPHDLFSEVGVGYTHMLSEKADVFGYVGYPGEPALGPNAFMHRISAFHNPDAPLGHHWQDATHILFGVATAGVRYGSFKLEGSNFTGREPDEHRYGFDKPRFDSYSYRLTANPGNEWSMQFSQGFIKSPEVLTPDEDVTRTTASVLYSRAYSPESHITATLAWGLNDKGDHHKEHSALLEANLQVQGVAGYTRYEFVQKDGVELGLPDPANGFLHGTFNVHALTIGTSYRFLQRFGTDFNIGMQGSVFIPDDRLKHIYGNRPLSAQIYLQITPSLMQMVLSNHKTRPQTEHMH